MLDLESPAKMYKAPIYNSGPSWTVTRASLIGGEFVHMLSHFKYLIYRTSRG